ncbi:MAG: tetratricopeptide repeat-containing protein, partial [Candidatus Zipacnadales bacterium]
MAQTNDRKLEREAYQLLAEAIIRRGAPLVAYEIVVQGLRFWPQDVRLRQLMALALARSGATQRANELLQQLVAEGCTDEETMGLLARTHKDLA